MNSVTKSPLSTPAFLAKAVIGKSFKGGEALFATAPINKNEIVAIKNGPLLSPEQLGQLTPELARYAFQIEDNLFIGPTDVSAISDVDHINHSCEPNCGISGQVSIIARRDIEAGEELTLDYAMFSNYDHGFNCNCESDECRGLVLSNDHRRPELIRRYNGYFSHWIGRSHNKFDIKAAMAFEETGAWGLDTAVDLHDCDPELIRSAEAIRQFTIELCELIKVNRFGDPVIVHFGEDEKVAGYSLVQLIETSLVSGHFANLTNRAYIDIFSCAYYDRDVVAEFAKNYFKAKEASYHSLLRH